ncbi:MAG: orotate phosphoribosyltransferase [Candidatus Aenigmatarchaeota archaeon]
MQVPALCHLCNAIAKPAYTCKMCGMIVCSDCFNVQTGMCIICSQKFGRRRKA